MGGVWLTPRPGRFTPGKETRCPLYRRLGGPQGRSGQMLRLSPPLGFDPRHVEPVTNRYTDYAIPAHKVTQVLHKIGWSLFYFILNLHTEVLVLYRVIRKSLCTWRWPSQNTFGMRTVLYWTRSSRTQFGVSINVWRLAGGTLNITCNFLYCNNQVHRDFLIILYMCSVQCKWLWTATIRFMIRRLLFCNGSWRQSSSCVSYIRPRIAPEAENYDRNKAYLCRHN
jgi:hypothetical protein